MTLLAYTPEEEDGLILISKEFKDYCRNNSVMVGGLTSISTFIACLIEFKNHVKKL